MEDRGGQGLVRVHEGIGVESLLEVEVAVLPITADELADKAGTISYEILLSISERVPRVYTKD